MVFNNLVRKGVMVILAATFLTIFSLNAIADGINGNRPLVTKFGFGIIPAGSISSGFDLPPFFAMQHISVNQPAINGDFQLAEYEIAMIESWQLIIGSFGGSPATESIFADVRAIPLFLNQSRIEVIGCGTENDSFGQPINRIDRRIAGLILPPEGYATNINAAQSRIDVQVRPISRIIQNANGGWVLLLPSTCEPNASRSGRWKDFLPSSRGNDVVPPIIQAVPVESAVIQSRVVGVPKIEFATAAPIGDIALAITDHIDIEMAPAESVSEIGSGIPLPTGDQEISEDGNETSPICPDPTVFFSVPEQDVADKPAHDENKASIRRPIARNTGNKNIGPKQTSGVLEPGGSKIPIQSNGSKEQPFIPLYAAGDKVIVNGVSFSEHGKDFHKPQRKFTEFSFALKSLTQNCVVQNNGGTCDVQRYPIKPRAPADVHSNV